MRVRIAIVLLLLALTTLSSAETVDFDKFVVAVDDSRLYTLTEVTGNLAENESYSMGLALPFRDVGTVFELKLNEINKKDTEMELTFKVSSEVRVPYYAKSLIFLTPISAPIAIPDWDQVEQGVDDHKVAYNLLGWKENFTRDTPAAGEHTFGLKVRSGAGTTSNPYTYYDVLSTYDNTTGWVNSYDVHMTKIADGKLLESAFLGFDYTPDASFTPLTASSSNDDPPVNPLPVSILPMLIAFPIIYYLKKRN